MQKVVDYNLEYQMISFSSRFRVSRDAFFVKYGEGYFWHRIALEE